MTKRAALSLTAHSDDKSTASESHLCVDCGFDTAPGCPTRKEMDALHGEFEVAVTWNSEIYMVKDDVW